MASVAAKFSFACPNCDKVLRTSARPAEGKKIKCPECGKAFVPELDEDDDGASIQEKPVLKGKSKASASANGKATRPKVKTAAEKKPGGSNMLVYGLIGAGALVLLLGCAGLGVTAFVWPGFLRGRSDEQLAKNDTSKKNDKNEPDKGNNKNDGNKNDDNKNPGPGGNQNQQPVAKNDNPTHFVLADSDILIGMNIKGLSEQGLLDKLFKLDESALGMAGGKKAPEEIKELYKDADRVLMSMQIPTAAFEGAPDVKKGGGIGQPPIQFPMGDQLPPGGQFQPPGGPFQPPGGQIPPGGKFPPPGGQIPPGGQFPPPGGQIPPGGKFPPPGGQIPPGGQFQPPGGQFPPGGGGGPFQPAVQNKPKVVAAILASTPAALNKFKSRVNLGGEKRVGRYAVYQPANANDLGAYIVFPGDRLVLFCDLNESELIRLLDQGASNQAPINDALRLSQSVEQAHVWGTVKFNDAMRRQFQNLDKMAEQAPELRGMSSAMQRAKGASLAVDCLDNGNSFKGRLNVECASDADALDVRKGADGLKGLLTFFLALQGPGKGLPASVNRDLATLAFTNQGVIASASISVTMQAVQDLAKLDGGAKKSAPFNPTDPFPKDPPIGKGKLINPPTPQLTQQYVLSNLQDQANDERGIQLNQGQKIEVRAVNNTIGKGPRNNVDFYVFRGDSSDNKNIIAYDQKPIDKDRATGHIAKVQFTVPQTGPYYIRVVNRGPGPSTQVIVQIQDITGLVVKETPKEKEKEKDKDKQPKFPASAKKAPDQYAVPNMVNGHTDTKLFILQPGKVVDIRTQFLTPGKQRAEVEIIVLKGETGNEVVARKSGTGPLVILQFTPAGEEAAVYRVRIHNRGPNTALNCGAQVVQQP